MLRLIVEKGEPAGAVFELKEGESTLGRSHSAAFRLSAPDVSGQHARIRVAGGAAQIENLSQFGTRVDDAPVTAPVALVPGQRLALGKTTVLRLEQVAEAAKADLEAETGKGGPQAATGAAPAPAAPTAAAPATRPPAAPGATRADAQPGADSDLTGALSRPDATSAASGEGMTRAMQTRAATPEEIELLKLNEQKRLRRRTLIGVSVAIPVLLLVIIFRPRTPPPETELEWAKDAGGAYLDAFEPAPSGGIKDGGYEVMYPDNKTFKKRAVEGGVVLEGWIGRDLNVPMRVILQEENEVRLTTLSRAEMVDDWMRQMGASGGRWNFDKPSPIVNFFGSKNGVPYTRVTYLRDGDGSWFGTANVIRHGCRRITARAEVPANERVRAEKLLSAKLVRTSDDFEYTYWEGEAGATTVPEEETLSQVRTDLERMAPATWVALEEMLIGVLTKAVPAGHKEAEAEALKLLAKLRERQALWFNSQQLAFDAAQMQGNPKKALKIAEFTKAVFANSEDQRYFTVRKWKVDQH